MIIFIVYKTTNIVNNKIYIGQHKQNINESYNTYLGSGTILKKAILKYGKNNFKKEIIDVCINEYELNEKEKYWIEYYNSNNRDIGYNILSGGEGEYKKFLHHGKTFNDAYGIDKANEIKNKISNGNKPSKGKTLEDVYGFEKANEIKNILKNRIISEETRHKMSISAKKRCKRNNDIKKNEYINFLTNLKLEDISYNNNLYKKIVKISKSNLINLKKDYQHIWEIIKKCRYLNRSIKSSNYKHTKETKKKISDSRKGIQHSKVSKLKNKTLEDIHGNQKADIIRNKISESSKNRRHSEETKRKISNSKINIPRSKETKDKISKKLTKNYYIIDDIIYNNYKDACNALGINRSTLKYRCNSLNFNNYKCYK